MTTRMGRPIAVTRDEMMAALARLGLGRGDVLFVHNSIKALGYVAGGPEAAVDAWLFTVGPAGHVVVPTFTSCRVRGYGSGDVFDPATTRSRQGLMGETLRRRPNAVRSLHPTKSVAVIGPRAAEFVSGAEGGTDFDIDGPFGRLAAWGAWVVFFGARISSNTMLHAVEDWLDLPYLEEREALMREGEAVVRVPERRAPVGHRGFYGGDAPAINQRLLAQPFMRKTYLHRTRLLAMPVPALVRFALTEERSRPGALLCDDPACDFCPAGRAACASQREYILDRIRMVESRGLAG
jgi:aminoglycoside 3-N-acetyltransferase